MTSHVIRAIAYAADRNELTVTFTSGRAYLFSLVPYDVFAAFEAAASKGAFFNARIRDRYPHRRVGAQPASAPSLREALLGSR